MGANPSRYAGVGIAPGVAITGVPAAGNMLVASSATAAAWEGYADATTAAGWSPADAGLLAWTYDPVLALNSSTPSAAGAVNLVRVNVRQAISCTNVVLGVATAGTLLTASENFAGLYAGQTAGGYTAGHLIGTSADQSTAWATAGYYPMALASGPFALVPGFYWVAILANSSGGTSACPAFTRTINQNAGIANLGLAAASSRYANTGTGDTTLPASFTPSGLTQAGVGWWAGLS